MDSPQLYLGIDPGQSGGIALLGEKGDVIELRSMKKLTESDVLEFLEWAMALSANLRAVLEKISAYPLNNMTVGMLAKRMPLVENWGVLWGLLTGLRITREQIRASDWQRSMGCLTKGDKKVSYRKAQELFPNVKVTHWNADALLIAEFCRRTCNARNGT